ncbi:276L [Invertebrate iridescent virus 6]|uniref:276L n=1 Tax=Invertebrate iridescent virus 6 TaxID=176652 RepID=Q91FP8_IIV6|nr:276L [Invertebrate iridescent virus 6]AAK82137.1 276L [Invertebrate iridescent virus 6]QMS79724.1 hypothetical protein IIV6-T1_271 [Invertebrate iridescent virus 6]
MRLQFLDLPGSMNIHIRLPLTKLILWEAPIMVSLPILVLYQLQALLLKLVLLVLVLLEVDKTSHKHSSSLLQH